MGARDWFRSDNWNDEIAAEFEKRLARSRTRFNQAQYLKIQGLTLLDGRGARIQEDGVRLLRRVITDYPDQVTEVAHTHEILANYFKRVGNFSAAEAEYREVLRYYAAMPSRTCTSGLADLSFVELILDCNAQDFYEEAENLMRELSHKAGRHILFNSDVFRYHAAFARVLSRKKKFFEASQHAEFALKAGEIRSPQFSRHPTVGIPNASKEVITELKKIYNSLA